MKSYNKCAFLGERGKETTHFPWDSHDRQREKIVKLPNWQLFADATCLVLSENERGKEIVTTEKKHQNKQAIKHTLCASKGQKKASYGSS